MKKALIVWGGWDGHEPKELSEIFEKLLVEEGYDVASGVGLAGCHGGMCDAFRNNTQWQFMTGGQWVAHPGNDKITCKVNIIKDSSPIVNGVEDITLTSEQYYMHVDPASKVLSTTDFDIISGEPHSSNGVITMPVLWTKSWGKGKVFYNSLGHNAKCFDDKNILEVTRRGFLWATK